MGTATMQALSGSEDKRRLAYSGVGLIPDASSAVRTNMVYRHAI